MRIARLLAENGKEGTSRPCLLSFLSYSFLFFSFLFIFSCVCVCACFFFLPYFFSCYFFYPSPLFLSSRSLHAACHVSSSCILKHTQRMPVLLRKSYDRTCLPSSRVPFAPQGPLRNQHMAKRVANLKGHSGFSTESSIASS